MNRVLDRIPYFDPKSREYPIRTLLDTTQPRSYTWGCQTYLDQGREGACVGFAWAHELAAFPAPYLGIGAELAQAIYRGAKKIDPWPGEDYDGTAVLAGAKVVKGLGWMHEYRWAFGLTDLLAAVSRKGPAVLGINWYEGMFDTDRNGFVRVQGDVAGGHAILATGVNVRLRTVTLHNSWGPGWGVHGKAKITWDDLDRLLHEQGEACIPVSRVRQV